MNKEPFPDPFSEPSRPAIDANLKPQVLVMIDLCHLTATFPNWPAQLTHLAMRPPVVVVPITELTALYDREKALAERAYKVFLDKREGLKLLEAPEGAERGEVFCRLSRQLLEKGHSVLFYGANDLQAKIESSLPGALRPHFKPTRDFQSPLTSSSPQKQQAQGTSQGNDHQNQAEERQDFHPGCLVGCARTPERCRVLIDTSALMNEISAKCITGLVRPWAVKMRAQFGIPVLAVPKEVLRELETMSQVPSPSSQPYRQNQAKQGIRLLHELLKLDVLQVFELGQAGPHQVADDVLMASLLNLLLKHPVVLLTCDQQLALGCTNLHQARNDSPAYEGRRNNFAACRPLIYNNRCLLRKIEPSATGESPPPAARPPAALRPLAGAPLSDRALPKLGDVVMTPDGRRHILCQPSFEGGEGMVYSLAEEPGFVAKIYKPACLVKWRFDKLAEMISNPVTYRGVVWPRTMLLNRASQPVGFLMENVANSVPIHETVFSISSVRAKFPHWKRRHLVVLARNLASVISFLHKRGEVIGDLNPANVLVGEEAGEPRVRLVDTDSWQFNGFPSPVGKPEYTHPDLRGRQFDSFLRQQRHDQYALAIIIFQILFLGSHPYRSGAEMSLSDCMVAHKFPYPLSGKDDTDDVPRGASGRIWSHLTWELKRSFHAVFGKGQDLPASDWADHLKYYQGAIDRDHLDALGQSNELLPNSIWVPKHRAQGVSHAFHCTTCPAVVTYYGAENIARINLRKDHYRCNACTDRAALESEHGDPRLCSECTSLFRHPIWFEKMIEANGHSITDRCPQHGGVKSLFRCTYPECKERFSVHNFDFWKLVSGLPNPLCNQHRPKRQRW